MQQHAESAPDRATRQQFLEAKAIKWLRDCNASIREDAMDTFWGCYPCPKCKVGGQLIKDGRSNGIRRIKCKKENRTFSILELIPDIARKHVEAYMKDAVDHIGMFEEDGKSEGDSEEDLQNRPKKPMLQLQLRQENLSAERELADLRAAYAELEMERDTVRVRARER